MHQRREPTRRRARRDDGGGEALTEQVRHGGHAARVECRVQGGAGRKVRRARITWVHGGCRVDPGGRVSAVDEQGVDGGAVTGMRSGGERGERRREPCRERRKVGLGPEARASGAAGGKFSVGRWT